tara:strand:- start:281 stop:676 length:396 start_codon:yes stop_codon:yes gene_type:complete
MILIVSKNFLLVLLILLIGIVPIKSIALDHDWVSVSPSKYGEQVWDKKNVLKNDDGSIRVLSKFIPIKTNEITKEILYTMDINCNQKTFRDVALGSENFNEFENINARWKYPNGDKLILGVIDQVCDLENT